VAGYEVQMSKQGDEGHSNEILGLTPSDGELLRSNIPAYSLVGFACATTVDAGVTLTMGLVTRPPFPESRPIRVIISAEACRELARALDRVSRICPVSPSAMRIERHVGPSSQAASNERYKEVSTRRAPSEPWRLRRARQLVNSSLTRLGIAGRSSATQPCLLSRGLP
jgi:hypothetical protein